jgi:phage gp36-like protein
MALTADGQTSGTNTAADMDDAALSDAVHEASSIVDTYVGGPYGPADSVPNMVVYWTRDVAAFLATCTWRKSKDFEALDPVYVRYQQAIARMEGIFLGTTAMPSSQMPSADVFSGMVVNPFVGPLFCPWDFDLTGESTSGDNLGGWPLVRWPGYVY